ncbi:hypothetical protein P4H71_04210 [Paenibacillus kribbensis]|uniref:BC1872 family protein n=1 Tax=Paenibacillus kribbensis TaxID=172713 RepID=UPI002DBB2377|nr:hypothetical protein [Paenibacillus kribbensis]MEC0233558.1 hypothetical protein [Paenibacillus kribbensis]
MTRDEVIAKWNSMKPQERDIWVATAVMGYKADRIRPGMIINSKGYSTSPAMYSTDIGAAWEVSQKYPIMKLTRTKIFEISLAEYICTFWNDADSGPIEVPATTAQEAVCLAALIAVLTQGEGIEDNG